MAETRSVNVTSGLRALTDIAWMARRQASIGDRAQAGAFDDACWLLHKMAASARLSLGHPDRTANRDWDEEADRMVETPSFFADGAPVDYVPSPERVTALVALHADEAAQWMVEVIHPLAHVYADGRSTYAPGMFNDATRILRAAGFDLSATESLGKSVWVTDGGGDSFLDLRGPERAERDAARAGLPLPPSPF